VNEAGLEKSRAARIEKKPIPKKNEEMREKNKERKVNTYY